MPSQNRALTQGVIERRGASGTFMGNWGDSKVPGSLQ